MWKEVLKQDMKCRVLVWLTFLGFVRRPSADTVEDVFSKEPGWGDTGAECEFAEVTNPGAGERAGESCGAIISSTLSVSEMLSLLVLLGLRTSEKFRLSLSELPGLLLESGIRPPFLLMESGMRQAFLCPSFQCRSWQTRELGKRTDWRILSAPMNFQLEHE